MSEQNISNWKEIEHNFHAKFHLCRRNRESEASELYLYAVIDLHIIYLYISNTC